MKNLKLYDNIDEQEDDLLTPKPKYFLSYVYDIKESGCNDIDTNLEEMIPNNYIDTTNKRGAYFNTTYHPTDNTRIVCKFTVSSTNYGMIFSSSDSTGNFAVFTDAISTLFIKKRPPLEICYLHYFQKRLNLYLCTIFSSKPFITHSLRLLDFM